MTTQPSNVIFVVDDDEAVRDSLLLLLESNGHHVRAFAAARPALDMCAVDAPGCVITDVRMPEMDGLEFQEQLAKSHRDIPVIIITGHADIPLAVRAMKAGAVDFIEKPFSHEALLASIKLAMTTSAQEIDPALQARLDTLTPREREVLELLVIGHPNKVIAHRLDISPRTVEIHRARVLEKMKATSLPQLVRLAMRVGVNPAD
jgi:two-component system, LuxR family, response regulator FixJ